MIFIKFISLSPAIMDWHFFILKSRIDSKKFMLQAKAEKPE